MQQERQRLSQFTVPWLLRQDRVALQRWQKMLREVDARIAQQIAAQPDLAILRQVKGVGPVLLATLVAQLPELGQLTGKVVTKLVGVAPLACDSGTMRGSRRAWGGRHDVRTVLYMATLTAVHHESRIRAFYQSLRARGNSGKVALVAAMRKLLVILNAKMRNQMKGPTLA